MRGRTVLHRRSACLNDCARSDVAGKPFLNKMSGRRALCREIKCYPTSNHGLEGEPNILLSPTPRPRGVRLDVMLPMPMVGRVLVIYNIGSLCDACYLPNSTGLSHKTGSSLLPARCDAQAVPGAAAAGEDAAYRFLDFFAARIRNRNTCAAYYRNVCNFFRWLEARHVHELTAIRSHHVAGYVEQMTRTHAAPTAEQHLAAIRMLFGWLIVGQVMSYDPAAATGGPKHVVDRGKTPVLPPDEARKLSTASQRTPCAACATGRSLRSSSTASRGSPLRFR